MMIECCLTPSLCWYVGTYRQCLSECRAYLPQQRLLNMIHFATGSSAAFHLAKCTYWSLIQVISRSVRGYQNWLDYNQHVISLCIIMRACVSEEINQMEQLRFLFNQILFMTGLIPCKLQIQKSNFPLNLSGTRS